MSVPLKNAPLSSSNAKARAQTTGFVSNVVETGTNVLELIEHELSQCKEFVFCVAFLRESGVLALKTLLTDLAQKGIKGRVLTTDYVGTTDPASLKHLADFDNIEVRMFRANDLNPFVNTETREGFHAKGYLFFHGDKGLNLVIGSSNVSAPALTTTREWNTYTSTTVDSALGAEVLNEFEFLWSHPKTVAMADYLDAYTASYNAAQAARREAAKLLKAQKTNRLPDEPTIVPNAMQKTFCQRVVAFRDQGEKRALLIAATGTGKTYAAAFAVRDLNPKRFLFLVHSKSIKSQALETFKRVLGDKRQYCELSSAKLMEAQYADVVFSTVQTMALHKAAFRPTDFDVICVDEAHHVVAGGYRQVLNYFTPRFMLGLTATPERRDDGDVFAAFDNNIAYEIRLQDALKAGYLTEFHYFGVDDVLINGKVKGARDLASLTTAQRVQHVITMARYYRQKDAPVRGLVFCSRNEEAEALAKTFTEEFGEPSMALSGKDPMAVREAAMARLAKADGDDKLHYLFTVDIFNEGVDIPSVNQVILLRPTESPVVFTQQLGRGLRRAEGKAFVVVLDFIANYDNNYLIPVALTGSRAYNKQELRLKVAQPQVIGSSTIHFSEKAKEAIFRSLASANFGSQRFLCEEYLALKQRLNRAPTPKEFLFHNAIDPYNFMAKKATSFWALSAKFMKTTSPLSTEAHQLLAFYGKFLGLAPRPGEGLLIRGAAEGEINGDAKAYLRTALTSVQCAEDATPERLRSQLVTLTNEFWGADVQPPAEPLLVRSENGAVDVNPYWARYMETCPEFRQALFDLGDYLVYRWETSGDVRYKDTALVLGRTYTYPEVEMLLNWPKYVNGGAVGGYQYNEATGTMPVFVNYDKAKGAIQYGDKFEDSQTFVAHSKTGVKLKDSQGNDSTYVEQIYHRGAYADAKQYLFLRKANPSGKPTQEPFYFLGEISAIGDPKGGQVANSKGKLADIVEVTYELETPVRQSLYDFFHTVIADEVVESVANDQMPEASTAVASATMPTQTN